MRRVPIPGTSLEWHVHLDGTPRNAVVSYAIGGRYYADWENHARDSWIRYCSKIGCRLAIVTSNLDIGASEVSNPYLVKLALGRYINILAESAPLERVCYLDSDVLISPFAPDIFEEVIEGSIGLVSVRKNLPFNLDLVLRRLAFLRNMYFGDRYPLDSSLFISLRDLYATEGVPIVDDEACTGVIVFDTEPWGNALGELGETWANKHFPLDGTEQTALNSWLQQSARITWLDYRFQTIWVYEMARRFPFLYQSRWRAESQLIVECVKSVLLDSYFLHFAGSLPDSDIWKSIYQFDDEFDKFISKWQGYSKITLSGRPRGVIKFPT